MNFNKILDSLALKFRDSKLARILFKYPYHKLLDARKERRRKKFLKYGPDVLRSFHECMENNKIKYTLAFGTLLGAIRECNFISHDLDIDVAIWHDDYTPQIKNELEKSGFRLLYRYAVSDGKIGLEETYIYRGVTIDIFYFYQEPNKLPYCCDFIQFPETLSIDDCLIKYGGLKPRKIYLPLSKERRLASFLDMQLYVPDNYSEILEFRYGVNYMIPNKKWSPVDDNPYIVEMNDMVAMFYKGE